ncbi:MAG: DUF2442 domain-containing protein [Nitrospirae bacterium]|uniref:DUF2442 domain-containing protein n=1 Tax=Candidatus Magnetobacterium casense TaxID=1455061 RepID=UPI00058E490D|nr:DUF2442 domain-containing protein [Candidatus Magnetobacterium casensis]MBF0336968.1 DUF2442 domain-containing protein [Nitrospirota bacterium]
MQFVRKAAYVSDYKLMITFDNGIVRYVDLEEHLDGEIFEPLRDINYFKTVCVNSDIDTICWDNGAGISPDFLYEIGVEKKDDILSIS